MINTLYISTVDHDWNNKSILLDRHNLNKIINRTEFIDCHTSVEDLFCENISIACNNANKIILIGINEDIKTTNLNCYAYGRLVNELLRHQHKIDNFNWNKDINYLKNKRHDSNAVLWTVGCSVTWGIGVNHSDRWGTLLSNYLNLPEIMLAAPGSSIFWSADQILRSDIREGDSVVWGVTSVPRLDVADNWNFRPISTRSYTNLKKEHQYWNMDYFESESQVLFYLRNILQVVNFCQKAKAKLYLANMLDIGWVGVMLKDFKNFIDLTQDLAIDGNHVKFIDLGTDDLHPGPAQHRQYAEKIFNLIKESNHGKTI
jgi:hypothetical protein